MLFPKCTGPFEVGCIDILTKAESIPKDFHPYSLHNSKLGSLIRLFYPCVDKKNGFKRVKFIPEPFQKLYAYGVAAVVHLTDWLLFRWFIYLLAKLITIEAWKAPHLIDHETWKLKQSIKPVARNSSIPVVIFSPGLHANRNLYSIFCTQLVSEGYIVAVVEHRDGSSSASFILNEQNEMIAIPKYIMPAGEVEDKVRNVQLNQRVREVSDAMDILEQLSKEPNDLVNLVDFFKISGANESFEYYDLIKMFKGRLDMLSVAVMGHSFGGATTIGALKSDSRFCCGVCLDPWFVACGEECYETTRDQDKSVLTIFTEHWNWKGNVDNFYKFKASFRNPDYAEIVTSKDTKHLDQCDIPSLVPHFMDRIVDRNFRMKRISHNVAVAIHREIISQYFRKFHEDPVKPFKLLVDDYVLDSHFTLDASSASQRLECPLVTREKYICYNR